MRKYLRYKVVVNVFFTMFLTLVIMNSITSFKLIESTGRLGKLIISLVSIFVLKELIKEFNNGVLVFKNLNYGKVIFVIIILCSVIFAFQYNNFDKLLYNLVLPVYFLFYFFITKVLVIVNLKMGIKNPISNVKIKILKTFRNVLFVNFLFWFLVAVLTNMNMLDKADFGGFFQDKIHFGLYVATGFLVSFYLRFNEIKKDKSIFNLVLAFAYLFFALITSRNALLIVISCVFYFFVIAKVKNKLYVFLLFLIPITLFYLDFLFNTISSNGLNKITTGRFEIWRLALQGIFNKGVLWGSGLFNLNDIVLYSNRGTGFYYLDTLDFLYFHSSYVELISGGGILAFVLFVILIIKSWKTLSRIDKALISSILIGALGESFLVQPFMLISILFYVLIITNSCRIKLVFLNKDLLKMQNNKKVVAI